jgi:hypothetical protein
VDFRIYTPGTHTLPTLWVGGYVFNGLEVQVASILEDENTQALVLSEPAPPMTVPGSLSVIYGAFIALVVLIVSASFFSGWGRPLVSKVRGKWRRWRTIRGTGRRLALLVERLQGGDIMDWRLASRVLDELSGEFRNFLSFLTGKNCRSLVPREFKDLPPLAKNFEPSFYSDIFRRCDALRFSGKRASQKETMELLQEVQSFVEEVAHGPAL